MSSSHVASQRHSQAHTPSLTLAKTQLFQQTNQNREHQHLDHMSITPLGMAPGGKMCVWLDANIHAIHNVPFMQFAKHIL